MKQIGRLLRRDWASLAIIAAVFITAVVIGRWSPVWWPKLVGQLQTLICGRYTMVVGRIWAAPEYLKILHIWLNNIIACLTAVISGMLTGPILPVLLLFGNGFIIGLFETISSSAGASPYQYYLSLAPHGLLELPAYFIAVWLAIRFGRLTLQEIRISSKHNKRIIPRLVGEFAVYFREEARFYSALIVVLLLAAAVIEIVVNPQL